jgi:signal transduction histidine kinase
MHEPDQGILPIDGEALRARTQLVSFPTMAIGLASMVLLSQYAGPAAQHPNAMFSWVSAPLCMVPYVVLAATNNLDYLLSRRGTWLRIVDVIMWNLCVFLIACTTHATVPASMMFAIAWAVVWPTWHPRNLPAASCLVWGMPLLRWALVPQATLASLAVLTAGGCLAFWLYFTTSKRMDRYREIRAIVKRRQLAIEAATSAQRTVKLAMSVHDGLSGLAAVAETYLAAAPIDAAAETTVQLLCERVETLLGEVAGSSAQNRLRELEKATTAAGLDIKFDVTNMQTWDEIASEDLLEIVTELITNHMRHGALARQEQPQKSGRIRIDGSIATIDLESQVVTAGVDRLLPFQSPQRGLRNMVSRIEAYGGTLHIEAGAATFRVSARIPNRRVAFAPPLLRTALPSFVVVFAIGFALMYWARWYFVWIHLTWYIVVFITHLKQAEILARRSRQEAEVVEAALLNLHSDEQRNLVRARLLPYRELLKSRDLQALGNNLTKFRLELRALLFALEWQGTPDELAAELGLPPHEAASVREHQTVPRERVHALALEAYGRVGDS